MNMPVLTQSACLMEFGINDSSLTIDEILSHLGKRFSDIYTLSPRRFEEAIASVYRALGWNVALTQQSRDGGIDIFCFMNSTGQTAIVECKRYARGHKVGIGTVDRLIGVTVRNQTDSAHLVTSSVFTEPAQIASQEATAVGIEVRLVDAHELLQLLGAYSDPTLTLGDLRLAFRDDSRPPPT